MSQAPAERWSDALLDGMRQVGDEPADDVIAEIFEKGSLSDIQRLMNGLVENDAAPSGTLPDACRRYFASVTAPDASELPRIERGEEVFATHGPEIVTVLLCASLPSAYACRRGVQVLHRTAYLARRPTRRIIETAQMVIDVMTPGGLTPHGHGIRSAQKVRLMHAAVRRLIRNDPKRPWDTHDLGIPINQADLAGTLMTFTAVVLDGLRRLDVHLEQDDEEALLDAWRAVGRVMGVVPELLPANVAEARALTAAIDRRETCASPEGREMMAALLRDMEQNLPPLSSGLGPSLVRRLIPPQVADGLGVPHHPIDECIVSIASSVLAQAERVLGAVVGRQAAIRTFGLHACEWLLKANRGGRRSDFRLPMTLRGRWRLPPGGHEPTVWERVLAYALPSWLRV
jgi:hypothetical protein